MESGILFASDRGNDKSWIYHAKLNLIILKVKPDTYSKLNLIHTQS